MDDQPGGTALAGERHRRPVSERKSHSGKGRAKIDQRLFDDLFHDSRTPLTVISEYLSLLTDSPNGSNDGERRMILDVIADRVDDLNHSITDLSDALKLATDKLDVRRGQCRVADIVARIRPHLERKAAVMNRQLQFDVPAELPDVYCDHEQIGRVLVRLTSHAIKDRCQQGLVLVWARHCELHGEVMVGVTEYGRGRPTTDWRRIPHAPGSFGSARPMGRRLQIARNLVRLNFGELGTESTAEGTTSRFELPLVDATEIVARYLKWRLRRTNCRSTVLFAKASGLSVINGTLERETNSFLGMLSRPNDLILQVNQGQWLVALSRNRPDLPRFVRRMEELREAANRVRRGDPLPAIRFEPLGKWRPPDGLDRVLETITISFDVEHASQRRN